MFSCIKPVGDDSRARSQLKPLHNFALHRLRWGSQISMLCMKANDHSTSASSSSSISADRLRSVHWSFNQTSFAPSPEAVEEEDGEGIEAVREKLMLDLKSETNNNRKELLKEDDDDRVKAVRATTFGGGLTDVTSTAQSKKDGGAKMRLWNLRTRRAVCRAPAAKKDSPAKEKEREKFALGLKRRKSKRIS